MTIKDEPLVSIKDLDFKCKCNKVLNVELLKQEFSKYLYNIECPNCGYKYDIYPTMRSIEIYRIFNDPEFHIEPRLKKRRVYFEWKI